MSARRCPRRVQTCGTRARLAYQLLDGSPVLTELGSVLTVSQARSLPDESLQLRYARASFDLVSRTRSLLGIKLRSQRCSDDYLCMYQMGGLRAQQFSKLPPTVREQARAALLCVNFAPMQKCQGQSVPGSAL